MDFEHTSTEMAEKLMEFIRDFSDSDEEIKEEVKYITEAFEKLKKSDDLAINALICHLDIMFMDKAFNK